MTTQTPTHTTVEAAFAGIVATTRNNQARQAPAERYPFQTMSDVRHAQKATGHEFFHPEAMATFGSVIESALYAGTVFITSEKLNSNGRGYTLRYVVPSGDVHTVTEAYQLATLDEARTFARALARRIRTGGLA